MVIAHQFTDNYNTRHYMVIAHQFTVNYNSYVQDGSRTVGSYRGMGYINEYIMVNINISKCSTIRSEGALHFYPIFTHNYTNN